MACIPMSTEHHGCVCGMPVTSLAVQGAADAPWLAGLSPYQFVH